MQQVMNGAYFDWHICIRPWPILKVMVTHSLTMNIIEMMTDRVKIKVAMK